MKELIDLYKQNMVIRRTVLDKLIKDNPNHTCEEYLNLLSQESEYFKNTISHKVSAHFYYNNTP